MSSSSGSGRSELFNGATDPVVVGLGRLLIGVGALLALGVAMTVAWLFLNGFGGI
jgi:hypothetical protein